MIFRELKGGNSVYMLNRDSIIYAENKVVSVGIPHIDNHNGVAEMVVDITLDDGKTYSVKDSASAAYTGNLCIAADKPTLLQELTTLKQTSENALTQIEHHKKVVEKASALLIDLNPVEKERKATEARFARLEEKINALLSALGDK